MKRIMTVAPFPEVLQKFADIVGPLYAQDSNFQMQNHYLGKLHDSLLPKLLSGKLSVVGQILNTASEGVELQPCFPKGGQP